MRNRIRIGLALAAVGGLTAAAVGAPYASGISQTGTIGDKLAAERDKARARAEALQAEAKKNPAAFAELAKKNSDDPGSAERGGDLTLARLSDRVSAGKPSRPIDPAWMRTVARSA